MVCTCCTMAAFVVWSRLCAFHFPPPIQCQTECLRMCLRIACLKLSTNSITLYRHQLHLTKLESFPSAVIITMEWREILAFRPCIRFLTLCLELDHMLAKQWKQWILRWSTGKLAEWRFLLKDCRIVCKYCLKFMEFTNSYFRCFNSLV